MEGHELDGVSGQETPVRAGGRPEYKPTDDQRATVRAMRLETPPKSIGAIAAALNISRNTLRKHFAAELEVMHRPVEQQLDLGGTHDSARPAPAPVTSRDPGRPEFEPTWRQREDVKLAKGDKWSDERIARFLGISRSTLVKHFAAELEWGVDMLRMQVLRDLKNSASKGNRAAAATLLNLPGMIEGVTELPGPEDLPDSVPAPTPGMDDATIGKKEKAVRDAQTAHQGTTWAGLVN